MDAPRRFRAACGVWLMLVGMLLLAVIWVPTVATWMGGPRWLPLTIGACAALTAIVAFLFGLPRLAIPAIVLGGTAYLIYDQSLSGRPGAWSYLWTAIIGLAGAGVLVAGMFDLQLDEMRSGVVLMVLSTVLYSVFGTWLGGLNLLNVRWVLALLMMVFILLLRPMVRDA